MPERPPNSATTPRSDGRIRPSANPDQSTSLSRPQSLADIRASIKSLIYKNLVASPMFPRLYADVMNAYAPNSHEARILAQNYEKILQRTNTERTNQLMSTKSCTHIKVTGVRCGSPALRGEQFCYFHQRMLRTVKFPASRVHHTTLLEDEESIQASLMEVVNSLLRGTIELKRAELILRALNTAVRNIRRVKFSIHSDDMVREIPDYPTPPIEQVDEQAAAEAARRPLHRPTHEEVARNRAARLAEYYAGESAPNAAPANAAPMNAAAPAPAPVQTHVATDAFVRPDSCGNDSCGDGSSTRPGGPGVSGRSAVPQTPPATPAAKVPDRKPPLSVKAAPASTKTEVATGRAEAPKERKSAAHSLP
jgi:hypothetical protein